MDKKDIGGFIQIGALVTFIALAFIFWRFNQMINPLFVVPILLAYQNLYVVPQFIQGLYKIAGEDCGVMEVYCPFVNELNWMRSSAKKIQIVLLIAVAALLLFNLLPFFRVTVFSDLITSMFGMTMNATVQIWSIVIMLFLYAAFCISRGIEYIDLRKMVYAEHNKIFDRRKIGKNAWLGSFMFFVPFLRCWAITNPLQLVQRMTKYNNMEKAQAALEEDGYEEE